MIPLLLSNPRNNKLPGVARWLFVARMNVCKSFSLACCTGLIFVNPSLRMQAVLQLTLQPYCVVNIKDGGHLTDGNAVFMQ
jgi:hypothetical protein